MEAVRQVHSEKDGPTKFVEFCCGAGMLMLMLMLAWLERLGNTLSITKKFFFLQIFTDFFSLGTFS